MSEGEREELREAGLAWSMLSDLPDWAIKFAARLVITLTILFLTPSAFARWCGRCGGVMGCDDCGISGGSGDTDEKYGMVNVRSKLKE